jgi:ubiquinone/menaquinone biosynthesis C-methylase UbiE/uncharacterized protein YbaR (Trm112 family)
VQYLPYVQRVHGPLVTEVLVTTDSTYAYPVWQGIVGLLPENAVALNDVDLQSPQDADAAEKHGVKVFYDQVGWQQDAEGIFEDARRFEDLRPVVAEYIRRCHQRVAQYIDAQGEFLLDVASGPVQYDEYRAYSQGYRYRVCVDISIAALRSAQQRLGNHGIYILGDITQMPFADETFEGAISLHTIYHVPAAQQPKAFTEIHRVLKLGHRAAVVYSWGGHAWLTRLCLLPQAILRRLKSLLAPTEAVSQLPQHADAAPTLTGHFFGYTWFINYPWPFSWQIRVWRSLSVEVTRTYIHAWLAGRWILKAWYCLEEKCPRLLARLGQYPIVVIKK